MIKKFILMLLVFFLSQLLLLLIVFAYLPFMHVSSGTEITLNNTTQEQYIQIRANIRNTVTKLNPPFDCDFDQEYWKANRDDGELMCQDYKQNELHMELKENNVSIIYNGAASFWIPTNEIITDEHKEIQKLFLSLAPKYKLQYPHNGVEVIFYHRDIPKGSRKLFSK